MVDHDSSHSPASSPSNKFQEIPDEVLVEIFRWVNPPNNEEWYFFMIQLTMVCRRWHQLLRGSGEHGNYLYKFIYDQLFGVWRNDPKIQTAVTLNLDETRTIDYWFNQLKREINFYRNCTVEVDPLAYKVVKDRSSSRNNVIVLKKSIGSVIAPINRSLKLNTGCYYFECMFLNPMKSACLDDIFSGGDNIFFGIELEGSSGGSYIGSNTESVGYYYESGAIYYGGNVASSQYGTKVSPSDAIGMFIDTNNLTLQFLLKDALFKKLDLKKLAPNIPVQLQNNPMNRSIVPCLSVLYDDQRMKLKCFEICSYEKCKWLQLILSD